MRKFDPLLFSRRPLPGERTVYLCSFKGTHPGWKGIVNRGIRALDSADYSHTEVSIGNPFEGLVTCISAVGTDGGVRSKTMQLHPDDWDILEMPWVSEFTPLMFLYEHAGNKYDYMGTGRFALPFLLREHPTKWFCTEVAMAMAGFEEPWRYTPQTAHKTIAAIASMHFIGASGA